MNFLLFIKACIEAYKIIKGSSGLGYAAYTYQGVPQITVLVGMGREAWRVSNLATEAFITKPEKPEVGNYD